MSDIAPLSQLSNALDTSAKFFRVLEKAGVTLEQIHRPINNATARRNLVAYLAAGCPKYVGEPETVPTPITFERNEHGHVVFTITGLDLSGNEEVERLIAAGYRVSDYAKSCLTSNRSDSYDANHRLIAGKTYKIALVPGTAISRDRDRTTANLRKLAAEKFGYQMPLAGIVPRIRESVSDEEMEKLGIWYVAALHDLIKDADGDLSVLNANRYDDGRWVRARWDRPDYYWSTGGAFAFLVPGE